MALAVLAVLGGLAGSASADTRRWVPTTLDVAGGTVTIAGPRGFCVDTTQSRDGPKGSFVLMGSCAALLGRSSAPKPDMAGVLTAAVSSRGGDTTPLRQKFQAMATFLASPAGRAALSRNHRAATVKLLEFISDGDVLYIHATDTAPAKGQHVDAEYWRALMAVKGQIVTLTVLGLQSKPLTSDEKRDLLKDFVAKIQSANRS